MELTEEEMEMMDMALSRMRAYQKASQIIITEHLARNGKGNIESRIRIVSLLFSYELVKGTPRLFYITDKGIRAQRMGVEKYMRAVEKKRNGKGSPRRKAISHKSGHARGQRDGHPRDRAYRPDTSSTMTTSPTACRHTATDSSKRLRLSRNNSFSLSGEFAISRL